MEPIRPVGRAAADGAAPVPAVRRLTPKEREDAARERDRRRRDRAARAPRPPRTPGGARGAGDGWLDVRA
jgi:hypothetical protein